MMKCEWILCPVCGSKTRNKIRKDTVLENYPLYCPKCRQERLIKVDNLKITVIKEPDALYTAPLFVDFVNAFFHIILKINRTFI